MAKINTFDQLRRIYKAAKGRSVEKVIHRFETHSHRFIALSPFLIIGSVRQDGLSDVTPRGDAPGFVKIIDDTTLAIPDRPGNNRLDTLSNILERPAVGLIFLISGVNETLRLNGRAEIRDDNDLLERFEVKGKLPATVLLVKVNEIYLHCAKSLMRAKLWDEATKIERTKLATMGQMINDQIGADGPIETEDEMRARYEKRLY